MMFFEKPVSSYENKNSGQIMFTNINQLKAKIPFNNFAIKYVLKGVESYCINGKNYDLKPEKYLLANHYAEGNACIDAKENVKGICIEIKQAILSNVVASFREPNTNISDLSLDTFFSTNHFIENLYTTNETNLGSFLQKIHCQSTPDSFTDEFYFILCEKIVQDHIPIYRQLQQISSVKYDTKKHLFQCVCRGKELMDNAFLNNLDIKTIAKEATLSEYHFFRLFKSICQITPYQYLAKKRLEFAKKALQTGNYAVSDIALETGFADIQAFSKAFKKMYGFSPSLVNSK